MSTDTPRTDAHEAHYIPNIIDHPDAVYCVPADFARQLERDLAAAQGVLAAVNAETMNTNTPKLADPIDECVRLGRELARLNEDYNGMLEEAVAVERERNALKAELAALREERETVDWLEKNMVGTGHGGKVLMTVLLPMGNLDDYEKPTLRAAVAAARKEAK